MNQDEGVDMNWKPLKNEGEFTVEKDGVVATLTQHKKVVRIRDTDIPARNEVADPEMLADGIPELCERHAELVKLHAKWVKQGWYPRLEEVPARHLLIHHKGAKKTFVATLDVDGALEAATEAVNKIVDRRQPAWMRRIEG